MPSVANTNKGIDTPDSSEKCYQVVEKKIRNLEKRKTRIQTLIEQKKGGKELDNDQMKSVTNLPLLEANLEQLRELLPQFKSILAETEKVKKRQLRREEAKKAEAESKRVKGTLSTLHMMSLFTQELKESLLSGLNGLTLTEEEISVLDGFYKVTYTPSVAWSELDTQLDTATSHIIGLLDIKDKEAFDGIKYQQIADLFEKLKEFHVFDPDYEPPKVEDEVVEETPEPEEEPEVEEVKEDVPEPVIEPEEIPVENVEAPVSDLPVPDLPAEPTEPATDSEVQLLNGDVPVAADAIVDFMHDSHLDRSESQLSPHAPEFQPGSNSPDNLESAEKATFGTFSQDETTTPAPEPIDPIATDPAVMAWSTGEEKTETPAPVSETVEPANPWSKTSTLDWGNTSLPTESETPNNSVWTTPTPVHSSWTQEASPAPNSGDSWGAGPQEEQPELKDQATQKVDDDGFTEQRRRGSNRRGFVRGGDRGGYRNGGDRGGPRGGSGGNRYNSARRYGSERGGRDNRGERGERGTSRGGRGGPSGRGGDRPRGGNSGGYRGSYRGNSRGNTRGGGSERGRPQQRTTPVAS